mgnify:CR=1 FL=1
MPPTPIRVTRRAAVTALAAMAAAPSFAQGQKFPGRAGP